MTLSFPITVIVRHQAENRKKCSVWPLRHRQDILFIGYPLTRPQPDLTGYVRLAADGPELTANDRGAGILLLDGSWRWAASMTREFEHVPPRSLSRWRTAYPRISRLGTDPDNGLASVEALFLAYQILGYDTQGLLDDYRWADQFLQLNELPTKQ